MYLKSEISVPGSPNIFPGSQKLARVMPIFRKGDQQNFRKSIEKSLHNRLKKLLNQNKCLYNYQFGFQNHHSMNHASITITEKNTKCIR